MIEESTEIFEGIQDLQDFLYSAPMEIDLVMLVNLMAQVSIVFLYCHDISQHSLYIVSMDSAFVFVVGSHP